MKRPIGALMSLFNQMPPRSPAFSSMHRIGTCQVMAHVEKYGVAWVLGLWALLRIRQFYFLSPYSDIARYFDTSYQWLQGLIPYAQFELEYPPGALVFFTLPQLLTHDFNSYRLLFCLGMLLPDLIILCLIWRICPYLTGSDLSEDISTRSYDRTIASILYILCTAALSPLPVERYDGIFSAFVMAWLYETLKNKRRWVSDLMLALGLWVKLISVILIPIYLAYLAMRDIRWNPANPQASGQAQAEPAWDTQWDTQWKPWLRSQALVRLGSIGLWIVALMLPFYLISGPSLAYFLEYHRARGIQIETLYANALLLWHVWGHGLLKGFFAYGAFEVGHLYTPLMASASMIALGVGLGAVSLWTIHRLFQARDQVICNVLLWKGSLSLILVFIVLGKVFSPQYLLWMIPLAALMGVVPTHSSIRKMGRKMGILWGLCALTGILIGCFYRELTLFEPMAVGILTLRNGLMIGLLAALWDLPIPTWISQACKKASAFFKQPAWAWVPAGLGIGWAFVLNLSPVAPDTLWPYMKLGHNILTDPSLLYGDISAAMTHGAPGTPGAYGQPWIAHGWLSGVLFDVWDRLWGPAGLSWGIAGIAALCFIGMYLSITPSQRRAPYTLLVLISLSYLIAFQMHAQPETLGFLGFCMMVYALERWRQTGRLRDLAWLVPVALVWVNLSSTALLAPVIMACVSVGVAALVYGPPGLKGSEPRAFSRRDLQQISCISLGMAAACLINPYGWKLIGWFRPLFEDLEPSSKAWTTPFLKDNLPTYGLWLLIATLALVWISVIVRFRQRPCVDTSLGLILTWGACQADLFVPVLAIFAFPIVLRGLKAIMDWGVHPAFSHRKLGFETAVLLFFLCHACLYGYAYSSFQHRKPVTESAWDTWGSRDSRWGFEEGAPPYAQVELIQYMDMPGDMPGDMPRMVFNEPIDGDFLIYALPPATQPVMDGRIGVHSTDALQAYKQAYLSLKGFQTYAQAHHITWVLLNSAYAFSPLVELLRYDPQWQLMLETPDHVLYAQKDSLIRRGKRWTRF